MLEALHAVRSYVAGMSDGQFREDRRTVDAVIRNLEVLGEAARHVPDEVRDQIPEVPWQDLADLRNILVHEYFGVDLAILWQAVTTELEPLTTALDQALQSLDGSLTTASAPPPPTS
jgi:uncharacterized protein with HEPN domain